VKTRVAILILSAALVIAQKAPAFEAASVKPAPPNPTDFGVDTDPGLLRVEAQTLREIVQIAYGVNDSQVVGGPKWAETDRFDIIGKSNGPAGSKELLAMLQTLLAERFKLTMHRETRTAQGYGLVIAKGGVKMQASESKSSNSTGGRGKIDAQGYSMPQLAERLTRLMRVPVEDATQNNARFNFTLKWDPASTSVRPSERDKSDSDQPSIFTALEEQLGLKLAARKVMMEVIVIDGAEKPSEN
jgi:uncharacterized protein (TIGR03435 family)